MLPAAEKITLVLEGIGDDNIRVNSASLDHPLVILPDQAIEIVAIEKKVMVGRVTRSAYAEPRPERPPAFVGDLHQDRYKLASSNRLGPARQPKLGFGGEIALDCDPAADV
jgi:hypothetical protein